MSQQGNPPGEAPDFDVLLQDLGPHVQASAASVARDLQWLDAQVLVREFPVVWRQRIEAFFSQNETRRTPQDHAADFVSGHFRSVWRIELYEAVRPRVEATAAKAAREFRWLDAEDLVQDFAVAWHEQIEAFFSRGETRKTPQHRAGAFVAAHFKTVWRDARRRRRQVPTENIELVPTPLNQARPSLERLLDLLRRLATMDTSLEPDQRLCLRGVYLMMDVVEPEFVDASTAILRGPSPAWVHFVEKRLDPACHHQRWRRVFGEILRCTRPFGESTKKQVNTAKNWIDDKVKQARIHLGGVVADEVLDRRRRVL